MGVRTAAVGARGFVVGGRSWHYAWFAASAEGIRYRPAIQAQAAHMGRKEVKREFPLFATLLTVCAVAVLCALGSWQVQRLHWKNNLIAQMEAARAAGPQDMRFGDITGSVPLYARLHGHYGAKVFLVGPRTYKGASGDHLLVPFVMEGGVVLVNRGWIPQGQESSVKQPEGEITVSGLLRLPERGNPFVPPNDPGKNEWFRADPVQMAQAADGGGVAPLVMYAEGESPESASLQPVRAALQWSLPNDHLQYAVFWFSMAAVLLVIYFLRFWRRPA